jgi:hypothetical protein
VVYWLNKLLQTNRHPSVHLQRAYNRDRGYFYFKLLRKINDKEELLNHEQQLIDFFGAYHIGYNLCPTAGSCLGRKLSLETKNKIRQKHLGKKLSEEHKKAIARSGRGRKLSAKTKKRMKLANLGEKNPSAKLKEADIQEMFALHKEGMSQRGIANVFGVARAHVGLILNKKRWPHIQSS